MASTEQDIEDTGIRASDAIAAIARCWRYPDEELENALENGLFEEELPATPTINELKEEYTRLFIGPGDHPCPPYESVYRDSDSNDSVAHVHGDSTRNVVDWYRRYDLAPDATWNDLPDHIAIELEFAGHLRENDAEALEEFILEHPQQWMPEFLTTVEDQAQLEFYRNLAVVTTQLIDSMD